MTEGKTWQGTFLQVLPMRKNAELVSEAEEGIDSSNESNECQIDV